MDDFLGSLGFGLTRVGLLVLSESLSPIVAIR
jgi:hypothetical protein